MMLSLILLLLWVSVAVRGSFPKEHCDRLLIVDLNTVKANCNSYGAYGRKHSTSDLNRCYANSADMEFLEHKFWGFAFDNGCKEYGITDNFFMACQGKDGDKFVPKKAFLGKFN
ncbi:uncharacterized protein BDW43DRAFT_294794 [Aspergillus alliaceus]|uniref:uncharacterized protein n=1 Tax=Petromyces alliaceus TaxID=209559 RepID=UPI0012A50F77|nr:uncharacterized protein BDW43DRAFT_294794 [Aspergillus alliaceus]KAB8227174.1 hypothetical protein BDW43DRAFT_294794 [Aspergillus alliaceus]